MRVVVIYKDNSDYSRTVIDFLHDFEHQTGRKLETMNPDDRAGSDFCEVYNIVEYPAIIAISEEGILQNFWRGLPLPTISEVSYYV